MYISVFIYSRKAFPLDLHLYLGGEARAGGEMRQRIISSLPIDLFALEVVKRKPLPYVPCKLNQILQSNFAFWKEFRSQFRKRLVVRSGWLHYFWNPFPKKNIKTCCTKKVKKDMLWTLIWCTTSENRVTLFQICEYTYIEKRFVTVTGHHWFYRSKEARTFVWERTRWPMRWVGPI